MGITTDLHICMLWFTACFSFSCADSLIILAREGSTAVLPCELINESRKIQHIQWRNDFQIVYERGNEELYEGERYKGRVIVLEKDLIKGNCSLRLMDVKVTDVGIYYSYKLEKLTRSTISHFIGRVELQVIVDAEESTSAYPLLIFSTFFALLFLFCTVKRHCKFKRKY